MAEPTAEAIRMAATNEAAWRMTARPLAAPASEVAPTWPARRANWTDSVTPMGNATKMVGTTDVPAMNAAWRMNSFHWNRPVNRSTNSDWMVRSPRIV